MSAETCDLAVVGAGSGGIGAALAASRLGARVLLIEQAERIGGNVVQSGVSVWEPGVGGTGLPFEIYQRHKGMPKAVGIYSIGRHCLWPGSEETTSFPGGESVIDPGSCYLDTLRRHGARSMSQDEAFVREHWHGVPFEPDAYCQVVSQMLAEAGCTVLTGTRCVDVTQKDGYIESLKLSDGATVHARYYVDSTADAWLASRCDCEMLMGQESQARFGEPDAPEKPTDHLNAVTLIYRVTPTHPPRIEPLPPDVPDTCWWRPSFPVASIVQYPCGDWNVNMLPTMEGNEAFQLGAVAAYSECRRRTLAHWHHNQQHFPEFQGYRISWIAPKLGVRETRRVVGEYVLTEHDLLAGLTGQSHDDLIAIADHAMDTHGVTTGRAGCGELQQPYGVPYRCLIPHGLDNLLVACRGGSFSSLAASSCRLSRTMMQLGQAAGTAAALAIPHSLPLLDVHPHQLQSALRHQHAQLEWPMSTSLRQHLSETSQPM